MPLPILEYLNEIPPYVPGKPIEEVAREMGITGAIKLASNENPRGMSPLARQAVAERLKNGHRYPDSASFELKEALVRRLGRPAESIVLGNGSDEIIVLICLALLQPGLSAVVPRPGFSTYRTAVRMTGATFREVDLSDFRQDLPAMARAVDETTRVVILNNPHNPTGSALTKAELNSFVRDLPPDVLVLLDEAYIDFAGPEVARGLDLADGRRPVAALWTFSKIYGLAGLRVGYGVLPLDLAGVVERIRMPFNLNSLAQAAALAALGDTGFFEETRALVRRGLAYFYEKLEAQGVWCLPSEANFVLVKIEPHPARVGARAALAEMSPAQAAHQLLLREGVIVRPLDNYGLPQYIRVTVGLPEENQRFIAALAKVRGQ
ncbi:MAG: histidinol-phosphate transaminase [Proteobacteria bacterium]|nr:histidinol-phosphate transaminase [Pseudomonadota bacterium]